MTHWKDYISQLAPENTLRQELEGISGQKEVWNTVLGLGHYSFLI